MLKRNTETRTIGDQTFTFYPISVRMLFELKTSMEPLMKGLKVLFNKAPSEGTQTVDETRDPITGKVLQRVTHLGTPDVAVLKARAEESEKSMREAIEAVLGESNRMLLGRLLADSLRDEGIKTDADISAFITTPDLDLPVLVEFLSGFFAVNAKVFGPFAQMVKDLVRDRMSSLTQKESPSDSSSDGPEVDPASMSPFGSVGPIPS